MSEQQGIGRGDVEAAWERVRPVVRRTPVLAAEPGAEGLGALTLKLEFLQHTGTFKARGAANRVLAAQADGSLDPRVGIVVASGGNAGLANAWVAARLGVPATVFVPTTAPPVKVALLESYGATVVRAGLEYAAAFEAAQEHVARTGAVYCHAYDQPQIVAGAGTLALELIEQAPVDTIVVAVGGGGLLAGVAAAVEDLPIGVVGVEPVTSCALHAALTAGEPVDVTVSGVAVDSLGARRVGDIAYAVARRTGAASVLVDDEAIVAARALAWAQWRVVLEHGAATALAAITAGAYRPAPDERVAVVLCGANTHHTDL